MTDELPPQHCEATVQRRTFLKAGLFAAAGAGLEYLRRKVGYKAWIGPIPDALCRPPQSSFETAIPAEYPITADLAEIQNRVKQQLTAKNWRDLGNGLGFNTPSEGEHYLQQFLWDSACHALAAISAGEIDHAMIEIRTLFEKQHSDGMMPHQIFWLGGQRPTEDLMFESNDTSDITQPPVVALAMEALLDAGKTEEIKALLPKLESFLNYLRDKRDFAGIGLPAMIHPNETGMDASPEMDRAMKLGDSVTKAEIYAEQMRLFTHYASLKYDIEAIRQDESSFQFISAEYTAIYAAALETTARMYGKIGDTAKQQEFDQRADEVVQSMIANMWDEKTGFFYGLGKDSKGSWQKTNIKTISGLLPILCSKLPKKIVDRLVKEHLLNKNEFATPFPIPVVAVNEKSFCRTDEPSIWRGGIWAVTNYLVIAGLIRHEYNRTAKDISKKFLYMVQKINSDFYERYDAYTGKGDRVKGLGWSTLALPAYQLAYPRRISRKEFFKWITGQG